MYEREVALIAFLITGSFYLALLFWIKSGRQRARDSSTIVLAALILLAISAFMMGVTLSRS